MSSTQKLYSTTALSNVVLVPSIVEGRNGVNSIYGIGSSVPITRSPPVNITPPSIAGSLVIPSVLTCLPGSWQGSPKPSYSYRWFLDGVLVSDQTSNTFVTDFSMTDLSVYCELTASSTQGTVIITTNPVVVSILEPVQIEEAAYYVITGSPITARNVMVTHRFYVISGAPSVEQISLFSHDVYVVETIT